MTEGPLHERLVLAFAGRSQRAPAIAARLLRDMDAEVVYVSEPGRLDAVERALLQRDPAIAVTSDVDVPELIRDRAVNIVIRHGAVPDACAVAVAAQTQANDVDMSWGVDGQVLGSDATAQAVAGVAYVVGERERAPLGFPARMGEGILGVNAAAVAILCELLGRRGTHGQVALSDLWGYAAGTNWLLCAPKGIEYLREGRRSPGNGGVYPQRLFKARDGMVALLCRSQRDWRQFLAAVGNPEWSTDPRYLDLLHMAVDYPDEVDLLVERETLKLTRAELFSLAMEHGFPLAPVRTPAEALADEYLERQGFWATLDDGVRMPGSLWREETWLPAGGSHASGLPSEPRPRAEDLSGWRVLDLSWVWAGPMVGSMLADLGAQVVKVEHVARLDNMRLRGRVRRVDDVAQPSPDIDPREIDPLFHNVNRGKQSMLLDMKHPEGRQLFLDLVRVSDVIIESFRPHVLDSWDISYDTLKQVNPKIVLLSLRGLELDESFGPSGLRSYAPITSSLSGLEHSVRYVGEPDPVGAMGVGVSDPVAGWTGAALVLAAMLHAAETGEGSWIRLSQLETLTSMLPEMFLEAQGAAQPDDEARAVVACGAEYVVTSNSGSHAVSESVHAESAEDLVTRSLAVGVDAAVVRPVEDHARWSEWFERDILFKVKHPLVGDEFLYSHGWRLDGQVIAPTASAPILGEDTEEILLDALGYDEAQVRALRERDVVA